MRRTHNDAGYGPRAPERG